MIFWARRKTRRRANSSVLVLVLKMILDWTAVEIDHRSCWAGDLAAQTMHSTSSTSRKKNPRDSRRWGRLGGQLQGTFAGRVGGTTVHWVTTRYLGKWGKFKQLREQPRRGLLWLVQMPCLTARGTYPAQGRLWIGPTQPTFLPPLQRPAQVSGYLPRYPASQKSICLAAWK